MSSIEDPFSPDMTLEEAKRILRRLAMEGGHACPVCTQFTRIYKRTIHSGMARGLIKMYRASGPTGWVEVARVMEHEEVADFAKLRYWDLVVEENEMRDDGSGRTGWWKITPIGEGFVRNVVTVPKHAIVYNGRLLRLDDRKTVTIQQALGKKFHYQEMMDGA